MNKTKLSTVIVVMVLVAAGFFFSRSGAGDFAGTALAGEVSLTLPGEQKTVDPDMSPPDFFIIGENKGETTLSELKGKPVFINFWNTWCPPCRAEMPELDKLYREYGNDAEFIFINITSQEESLADVTTFLSDNGYSIPVYLDRRGEVAGAYGIRGIPTTVVLDAQGEVVYAAAGQISYDKAKSLIK
ncbi:TlpA family protein disulfide reductase [Desulfoscipio geothermicus]|uniref:Thiol-disulfide isomerase or thioredoxin n=1 Tax=Desulfoscipio geothermicus DSM 3669 TaxID=1121426 RepID=A0A1I6E6C2_9FIRM|nr:redoxin family protein [Desulfoscipio geothermicus]SFR13304.1 Thiol-disulfide isomerase or thioredoxin [Desulfoscipio geothermicus DSM 3669]